MSESITTDVLVVGTGPAGATAALTLATLGVEHLVISKYSWTANTPRAHITNQRTVEIFRDLGIEADIRANGTPQRLMGDTVFCTSLSGDEIGRVRTWGTHPARQADYTLASPSENCDLPQTLLEPMLVGHAAARGSRIRFDTEYVTLQQHPDQVTVSARDRVGATESGREYTDLYDDWARLREVGEDGCVLVRPDAHVGWRSGTLAGDPASELGAALTAILDR